MQAHLDALHLGVHHAQRPEHSQKRKQLKSYAVIFARSARPGLPIRSTSGGVPRAGAGR